MLQRALYQNGTVPKRYNKKSHLPVAPLPQNGTVPKRTKAEIPKELGPNAHSAEMAQADGPRH
jgi:hypothetical protein